MGLYRERLRAEAKAKAEAARAMLAALHAAVPFIDTTGPRGAVAFDKVSRAIAAAEAAGIKS